MTILEILNILKPFREYLIQLHESEMKRQPGYEWEYSLSLSYTFITLKLLRGTKDDNYKDLYIEIIFRIEKNVIVFSEIHPADGINTQHLTEEIKSDKKLHTRVFKGLQEEPIVFSDEVQNYLSIADRISKNAVNMNTGDDYWPGNYSKVKYAKNTIVLEQINHMNSRSLNHKEDYCLRDLIFRIDLQNVITSESQFEAYQIGNMQILFSDRSSKNNRQAGDFILEQIKTEQQQMTK